LASALDEAEQASLSQTYPSYLESNIYVNNVHHHHHQSIIISAQVKVSLAVSR
jgi:hypothetical protein